MEGGKKGRRNGRSGGKEKKAEGSGFWWVRCNTHAVLLCAGVKVSCRKISPTEVTIRLPVSSATASLLPPLDMAEHGLK